MITKSPVFEIRQIDPNSRFEIQLIAERMRETLKEVVGVERGESMYSMDWLIERVRFHLDSNLSTAQVLVSVSPNGEITGHCIYRIEKAEDGTNYGLFSTTYVMPNHRRLGVAYEFLKLGESWMRKHKLIMAATATSKVNDKLIRLY